MNQLEEAKATYKQAGDKRLDDMFIHQQRFTIAYLEGDTPEMERQAEWASGKTEEAGILLQEFQLAASRGQLKKARELCQRAFDSAKKSDLQSQAAIVAAMRGVVEYWMGDPAAARSWSIQALDLSHDQLVWAGASLALAGDSVRPQKLIDAEGKRHPRDTYMQQNWIPQVRAALAIKRSNPAAAIEALNAAKLLEPSDIGPTFYRGMAYLALRSGKEAATEFEAIAGRGTISPLFPLHSIARLELARSLALAGDTARARTAYQDLIAKWKDADPDIPILKEAKAEYAKLQ
jgi:tetratricopeptide (TPR) repeat protein